MTNDRRAIGLRRPRPKADEGPDLSQKVKAVEDSADYMRDLVKLPGQAKAKAKGLLDKAKRMGPKAR